MVVLHNLDQRSAYIRSLSGPSAAWSITDHLLALVADELAVANWQRAGSPRNKAPTPIKRPGSEDTSTVIGTTALPLSELRELLDKPRKEA